jgi:spore coat protein CotH
MRGPARLVALVSFAFTLALSSAVPVAAQTAADVFDRTKLRDIQLLMNTKDLKLLRDGVLTNTYYPADAVWNGIRIRNVAIRNRGSGSRNPTKMGLRIDFNRYTKAQVFAGYTALDLDNAWQDPSLIREQLTMAAFRQMGQAAPKEAFVRLFINGDYQGLYSLVEEIDDLFTQREVGQHAGYLYEFHFAFSWATNFLGEALAPYEQLFQPQNHTTESEEQIYGPIRDLFKAVDSGADDETWRAAVDTRMDLPEFMTHVAIQNFLTENDGIMGYAGVNNFYLYRYAGTLKHRIFPWDEDNAFIFAGGSMIRQPDNPVILFQRAYAQPDLKQLFLDVAEQCAHTLTESGWLGGEVDRIAALITPAVLQDTRKQFSNDQFLADLDFIRTFAATRTQEVLTEIPKLR